MTGEPSNQVSSIHFMLVGEQPGDQEDLAGRPLPSRSDSALIF